MHKWVGYCSRIAELNAFGFAIVEEAGQSRAASLGCACGISALDILLLFIAGMTGGMLNSLAGGGSFVIFPALLFAGVPPVLANASNTYEIGRASCRERV